MTELVLTFDDLPVQGELLPGIYPIDIVKRICDTLNRYRIPQTYGFLIGSYLHNNTAGCQAVEHWISSGNALANHSFSHLDVNHCTRDDFIADVMLNQKVINNFQSTVPHFFRFPFLSEGKNPEIRSYVRSALQDADFILVPCSVHNMDFAWNKLCCAAIKYHDDKLMHRIRTQYLLYSAYRISKARFLGGELFPQLFPHVMLLHFCISTALFLPDLLHLFLSMGVHFSSLDEAIGDPVYHTDSKYHSERGLDILHQHMIAEGKDLLFPPCEISYSEVAKLTQQICDFYDVQNLR